MKAFELLILGKKLTSTEALQTKFVSKVFDDQKSMMEGAQELCSQLENLNQNSVRKAKNLMKMPIRDKLVTANFEESEELDRIFVI